MMVVTLTSCAFGFLGYDCRHHAVNMQQLGLVEQAGALSNYSYYIIAVKN